MCRINKKQHKVNYPQSSNNLCIQVLVFSLSISRKVQKMLPMQSVAASHVSVLNKYFLPFSYGNHLQLASCEYPE